MDVKDYKVKDSKFKYQRIKIETKYPNGKKGDLIIETPFLFSFGVNEKKSQETDKLIGYFIPVFLWEKDSQPNVEEKAFFESINSITAICQQHLENEYGADLAPTLNAPLYYKQVEYTDKKGKKKNKRDETAAPVLYAKLIYSEKKQKILSLFKTKGKQKLNPFDYRNQYCKVKMALIIEGIFISKNVTSLQLKIHEVREPILTIQESDEEDEDNNEKN